MRLTLQDLLPNTQYAVQVRANRNGVVSDWSPVYNLTTVQGTDLPATPTGATWVVSGDTFVASWNPVTTTVTGGGVNVIGYEMEFTANGVSKIVPMTQLTGATLTYTLDFDHNRTLFGSPQPSVGFRVRAVDNKNLKSAWTSSISQTNPAPGPVTNATATGVTDGIALTWTPPADIDLAGYNIYVGTTSGFTPSASNRVGQVPYTNTTTNAWTYTTSTYSLQYVKIRSVDKFGQESTDVTVSATPKSPFLVDTTAPNVPSITSATQALNAAATESTLTVVWSLASPPSDLAGFQIRYRKSGDTNWSQASATKDDTTLVIPGLVPYVAYEVQARAYDWSANYSNWSATTTAAANSNTAPAQVTGLTGTAGKDSIQYSWTASPEADVNKYDVTVSTSSTFASGNLSFTTATNGLTVSGLNPATTYYARVRAIDSGNLAGTYSSTYSTTTGNYPVTPLSDGNPPASSPAANVTPGIGNLFVSWSPVTNNDLVTYEVHISTTNNFTPNAGTKAGESMGTFITLENTAGGTPLAYGTTYYVKLIAKDRDGSAAPGTQGSGSPAKVTSTDSSLTAADVGAPTTTQFNNLNSTVNSTIKSYQTEYSVSASETVAPTTGWSTATPTRTPGTFVWYRVTVTYVDNTSATTNPALLTGNTGAQGIQGPPGSDGQSLYTWIKYADTPTTGMSDSPSGKTYIGIAVNKSTATESTNYGDYTWSLIKGDQGIQGPPGADGTTTYTWVKYADSATGTGLTDDPTGKTYIGLAFNKTTQTESTVASDYQWSLIQGPQGPAGTPAALVSLTANTQVLAVPATGGATTPATATVTGTATNTTISVYQYSVDGGAFSGTVPAGVSRTGNVVTITGSTMTARTITVRMADAAGIADTLTVAKVSDGATGATGGTGGTGPAGADAYTVILTNEAQVFPGSTNAANAGSATTKVIAYKGTSPIAATIGTVTGQVTGLTTAVTNNGTTNATVTVTVTTALTQPSGTLTIPVTVDGQAFTKTFSWSVSYTGQTGSQGIQGPPGADGTSLYTWLKYADTPTTGMSDDPTGKAYIGLAYNKTTATESTNYGDYQWTLVKGADGSQGIQGPPGDDGQSLYTWIKYGTSATGAGITDDPTGMTYIGVAYNKTTPTESSIASDYTWSLIQGPQGPQGNTGATGAPAPVISLTATSQVLSVPATGGATTPATTTVTGTAANTTISVYQYSVDGGAFSTTVPAGVSRTGNVVTITGSSMTAKTITVRMADANGVADTLTVAKVADGATGATGSTGGTGPAGADAYTVILSNEAQVFPGTTNTAVAGSTTTSVIAYKGTTQQTATIGTITGQVTGLTTAITNNGTTNATVTVTVTTALTQQAGTLTIPITVGGQTFTKTFAWSVSYTGATGATGSPGAPGAPAPNVTLTATSQILSVPATGGATTPATTTVTGTADNTTITQYDYSVDGAAFSTTAPAGVSRTTNTVTITGSTMTAKTITVRMRDANGVGNTITIAKVSDGATGATGSTGGTGPAGADAYTVILTNEANVFAGSTTAALAGSAATSVVAYKGTTQQTASVTQANITGMPTGMTAAVTNNGTTNVTITFTVTTSMTSKSGTVTIPVVVGGITFNKIFSYSISFQGAQGATGNTGATGATGPTGVSVVSITPYFAQVTAGSAAPAIPTTATPPAPWVTPEPSYTPNTELYRTEKVLFSDATYSYTAVSKVSAYTASNIAITAANGKNTVVHSTSAASGTTGFIAGDTWFQYDGSNNIIGQWRFTGTAWQSEQIASAVIANLDAGKITAGSTFTNALNVKSTFTLGDATTPGIIKSYNYAAGSTGFSLSSAGLEIRQGTIAANTLVSGTGIVNNLVVNTGGAIQSSNYSSTAGWKISPTGAEFNDANSSIKADAIKAGTLGGSSGSGVINIAAGTSLILNGGYLKSNTNTGTTMATAVTSGTGFYLGNDGLFVGGGTNGGQIKANALISDTLTSTTITLGTGGIIQGGSWSLSSSGLSIPNGGISAASLQLQFGENLIDPRYADFEATPSLYDSTVAGSLISTLTATTATTTTTPQFNTQALVVSRTGTSGGAFAYFAPSSTSYNIPVTAGTAYIVSAYIRNRSSVSTAVQIGIKWSTGASNTSNATTPPTANATWQRISFAATAPAGATSALVYVTTTTTTSGAQFDVDGVQVETQWSNSTTPSPWTPPSFTRIDAGMIRTGQIQSAQTTTVNGVQQPFWSIDLAGAAQFGAVMVRGNVIVGADDGSGGDADAGESYIQSSNYVQESSGWIIRSDGSAEFNDLSLRGDAIVDGTLKATALGSNDPLVANIELLGGLTARGKRGETVSLTSDGFDVFGADQVSITQYSITSNVATFTTANAHGFTAASTPGAGDGTVITIKNVSTIVDGDYTVDTTPTTTTFTIPIVASNVSTTSVYGIAMGESSNDANTGPHYISFPTDSANPNIISGKLTADDVTVTNSININGLATLAKGSVLSLQNNIADPIMTLTASNVWTTSATLNPNQQSIYLTNVTGVCIGHNGNYFVVGDGRSTIIGNTEFVLIQEFTPNWSWVATRYSPTKSSGSYQNQTKANLYSISYSQATNRYYVIDRRATGVLSGTTWNWTYADWALTFDTSFTMIGSYTLQTISANNANNGQPVGGIEYVNGVPTTPLYGTYILSKSKVSYYTLQVDPSVGIVTGKTLTADLSGTTNLTYPAFLSKGNFDVGTNCVVLASGQYKSTGGHYETLNFMTFNPTTGSQTKNNDWPMRTNWDIAAGWWDGSNFYTMSPSFDVTKYHGNDMYWTTSTPPTISVSYSWYDDVGTPDTGIGGQHDTAIAPWRDIVLPTKRTQISVTIPAIPVSPVGDADFPNKAKIWVKATSTTSRQVAVISSPLTTATVPANYSTYTAVTNPVNTFPKGGPSVLLSSTTLPDGITPMIALRGDGSGRVGPWKWDIFGQSAMPYLHCYTSMNQTVTDGSTLNRSGWTADWNIGGWVSGGSNGSTYWVVPEDGMYSISGVVTMTGVSASLNARFYIDVLVSGSEVFENSTAMGNRNTALPFSLVYPCHAGDTITIQMGVTGSNINTSTAWKANMMTILRVA